MSAGGVFFTVWDAILLAIWDIAKLVGLAQLSKLWGGRSGFGRGWGPTGQVLCSAGPVPLCYPQFCVFYHLLGGSEIKAKIG